MTSSPLPRTARILPLLKVCALLALGLAAPAVRGDDFAGDPLDNWHQWRGPLATGAAVRGNPPVQWDQKKNLRWKTPIPGKGSATPIVWGDRVFVVTAVDTGRAAEPARVAKPDPRFEKKTPVPTTYYQFLVLCLDRATGKVRWQEAATEQVPHEGIHPTHSYAAASPITDGRHLWVSFGSRGLFCFTVDGKRVWECDLGDMNTRYGWGEGHSPALYRDTLVVPWDQEAGSFVVALDAATGKPRWRQDRDEPTSWATPLIVPYKGRTQAILNATNKVRSYDLATGAVIWQCGGQTLNVIPSPVRYRDTVICMSGYRGAAAAAISLDARGDVTGTDKVLWRYDRGTPYVPSPLLVGDRLYFTQMNEPRFTCLDAATGKPLIDRERLPALTSLYASPVGAAGRIYLPGRDGTTVVLEQGDKLKVLAVNRLDDPIDASPAVAGKQLFLRSEKHVYCFEE